MNVFGRTSFIISLAFTLLISGITLFYYVNRFKHLEKTIIEQGRILQSFIIKSETQKCNLSSTIALDSAKQQMNKMSKDNKIEVSDDECHYDHKENIKLCKKKQMEKEDEDEDEEDQEDEEDEEHEHEHEEKSSKGKRGCPIKCGECDLTKIISQDYLNTIFCLNIDTIEQYDTSKKIVINDSADVIDVSTMVDVVEVVDVTEDSINNIDMIVKEEKEDKEDKEEKEEKEDIKHIPTTETLVKNKASPSQQKKINLSRLKLQELKAMVLLKHPEMNDLTTIKKEDLIKLLNEN